MFFCEPCKIKKGWPSSFYRSHGPCEVCGKSRECYEVPSLFLPTPAKKTEEPVEVEAA